MKAALVLFIVVALAIVVNPVPGDASRPHGGGIGGAPGGGPRVGPGGAPGAGPRVGPGWGSRGPGWGSRGPGWGPGWGSRGPGWGPGWGPRYGPRWGYGPGWGRWGGGPWPWWGFAWAFAPYWGWGYPYSYYYGYGAPAVIEQSPVYVEPAPQPAEAYSWYYCQNPRGYYPYVEHCPGGWTKVPPSPAAPGQ
ncbi:MAG: hypothetical protein RBS57_04495 [Desulforhabdus sp.]|jgi:hypothetical protein|nr:hypothetical protein [Desulforhabdus sp.]